jgi:hypothetical protein
MDAREQRGLAIAQALPPRQKNGSCPCRVRIIGMDLSEGACNA